MGGMKGFIAGNYIGVYHPLIIVLSNTLRRRNNTTMPRCKEHLKISSRLAQWRCIRAPRALRSPPVGKARNKTIRDNHANPMVDNS